MKNEEKKTMYLLVETDCKYQHLQNNLYNNNNNMNVGINFYPHQTPMKISSISSIQSCIDYFAVLSSCINLR